MNECYGDMEDGGGGGGGDREGETDVDGVCSVKLGSSEVCVCWCT